MVYSRQKSVLKKSSQTGMKDAEAFILKLKQERETIKRKINEAIEIHKSKIKAILYTIDQRKLNQLRATLRH